MRKVLLACLMLLFALASVAQEESAKPQQASRPGPNITAAYKIDLTISEFEGGKRISAHTYTLHQGEGNDWARLRMGSRVPVATGPAGSGQFSYMDAGVNLDTRLREAENGLLLDATVELTSILTQPKSGSGDNGPPVTRNFRYSTVTLITPGKPTTINAADDPASDRRIELEITATRLK